MFAIRRVSLYSLDGPIRQEEEIVCRETTGKEEPAGSEEKLPIVCGKFDLLTFNQAVTGSNPVHPTTFS